MALCDVIKVKGSKSIQIVRSQSRNGALTIAAFHLSDVGTVCAAAGVQARSPRKQDVPSHSSFYFAIGIVRYSRQ
jgi:hypothetical protein